MGETAHQRSGNFASPAGYNQYVAIQHRLGKKPLPLLAKFDARYRFAGQLNSIEILGLSADATDAYLSALRLALAYSALETLTDAAFLKGKLHVKDATLATAFRSARLAKFREFLIENTRKDPPSPAAQTTGFPPQRFRHAARYRGHTTPHVPRHAQPQLSGTHQQNRANIHREPRPGNLPRNGCTHARLPRRLQGNPHLRFVTEADRYHLSLGSPSKFATSHETSSLR
jgi:hypothetical protein